MRNTNNTLFVEYAQANNHLREIAWILNDSSHREIDRGHFVVKTIHDHSLNKSGYFDFHVLSLLKNLNQKYRPLWVAYERIEDWKSLFINKQVTNRNAIHPTIKSIKAIAEKKLNASLSLVQLYRKLLQKEFPAKVNSLIKVEAIKEIYYHLLNSPFKPRLLERVTGFMSPAERVRVQVPQLPRSQPISSRTSSEFREIPQTQDTGCLAGIADIISGIFHFLAMMVGIILIGGVLATLFSGLVEIITDIIQAITGS